MNKISIKHTLLFCFLTIIISACSAKNSRYQHQHDSTPTRLPNASELHDAIPRSESPSRGGNKNYQVLGKHYQVLKSAENFSQTGIASWYGRKFHGHLTSNGEIYDMYAMSAAHKNLPLPSYLKVVNNSNDRSVIVRVNDRGPFHQSRIIDLSYSAAYKLDMLKTGTANVTITAINVDDLAKIEQHDRHLSDINLAAESSQALTAQNVVSQIPPTSQLTFLDKAQYIQVFASKSNAQATKLANALSKQHQRTTQLEQKNGIFRVLVGPIEHGDELASLLIAIKDNGYPNAFIRQ